MRSSADNTGFTIIEMLVYLTLLTIVMGGLLAAVYTLYETNDRNQTKAMMQEEEYFLIGKINWVLSGAKTIFVPSQTTLNVTTYDTSTSAITLSGSDMQLNGNTLNNSNVKIGHLVFIHTYAGGTNPDSVEAGFTISATTPTGSMISHNASTTRYIRK